MTLLYCIVLVLLCVVGSGSATLFEGTDYGGIPLWINRLIGEPSVLSIQGRMDRAWFRANNPQACPQQCDCPIQWPTALYCDHRGLAEIPDPLPERTQYLFLQGNNISSLSSSYLANITGLRWLILDHNQLESNTLDQAFLRNQTQLYYFFANHNHLRSVPSELPVGLRQLRLAHNQISSISPETLQKLHNLTVLLLQGNRLKTISKGDLKGLVNLNLLDLSDNLFSSVPRHLPPSVQQLYLSNNSLSGLDEDSFEGFLQLKYLRLSHCGLKSHVINPQIFNVSSLVELDLSYNKLTTVPTVPTSLQYLYLEANKIQGFNLTSFCREVGPMSYSRMKILRLDGNKMTHLQLPPDWVFCLRVLQSLYI
ncbi:lumican [Notolabrus celidotus]|uniref:lumican n=1 Tax=Notolabrus celidotus TaxID=1203425 RepID=UPI00148F45EE|nr:lumican [Notolabrus celidotus]XP_034546440.1 lumican [Notolabrus celidotus]XP_034546445.1 lumican [Notolabrus celidotus]XP_034546451.1 lumican [Notolabrus celidotus]XP_034546458.1 lumican [Notolabrus celidotus]